MITQKILPKKQSYSVFIIIGLFIIFFNACTSPAPSPTSPLVPTDLPTITPFPIPDLSPVLSGRGITPSRVSNIEISETPHPDFKEMPAPADFTSLRFSNGPEFAGRVSIFIYSSFAELDAAWPVVLKTVKTPKEITGIGDLAAVNFSDLVFIRCSALVHIKLVGTQTDELLIYASFLEARLRPVVCPDSP